MTRRYQYNFSATPAGNYDNLGRERKARTMVAVLEDYFQAPLGQMTVLNVGSSIGIIDHYLAGHFRSVIGTDIDQPAIECAQRTFQRDNLEYRVGDALNLDFPDNTFEVVICSQVYEHVPNPHKMMDEIFRVLVPGGICYFAASNRLMWNEPHYNLPLLSLLPRPLADLYLKLTGKASHYHELHYTYWELKKLAKKFIVHDYTQKIICFPLKYHTDYMLPAGSMKFFIAKLIATRLLCLCPGYVWLLVKPEHSENIPSRVLDRSAPSESPPPLNPGSNL